MDTASRRKPKTFLAFCHIEKAAGTSLIHILRRIFFLRYAAARPMTARTNNFTARDLANLLRINPFVVSFGGHAVMPHGDILKTTHRMQFITQVRDPVERAISQYKFWVNRMSLRRSYEEFLSHPTTKNFQVKKLAGFEDLDLAKENISKHFLVAGTVKGFDSFLVLLAAKLGLPLRLFTYEKRNADGSDQRLALPDFFIDGLHERNELDRRLYDWIETEMLPSYVADYGGTFAADLNEFRKLLSESRSPPMTKVAVDFVYRNAYLKPVTGAMRMLHGLPFRGSYTT